MYDTRPCGLNGEDSHQQERDVHQARSSVVGQHGGCATAKQEERSLVERVRDGMGKRVRLLEGIQ